MNFFKWILFSSFVMFPYSYSSIALGDTPTLENCTDVFYTALTGGTAAGIWAGLLILMTALSRASGWIVLKYGTKAGSIVQAIIYLVKLLGWLAGNLGWGGPKHEDLKKAPLPAWVMKYLPAWAKKEEVKSSNETTPEVK